MGLEPTSGDDPPPVFKTGPSSGRLASVGDLSVSQFRGLESNQRPPGSEPGVTTSSNCPGSFPLSSRHFCDPPGSGRGIRTPTVRFKAGGPTVSRSPRVPCGSRTRLSGMGSRCLDRSAKGTRASAGCGGRTHVAWLEARSPTTGRTRIRGGRRGSRTPKAHRSAAFETAAIANWLALPRLTAAPGAGIEPANSSLTGRHMNQLMLPRCGDHLIESSMAEGTEGKGQRDRGQRAKGRRDRGRNSEGQGQRSKMRGTILSPALSQLPSYPQ